MQFKTLIIAAMASTALAAHCGRPEGFKQMAGSAPPSEQFTEEDDFFPEEKVEENEYVSHLFPFSFLIN